MSDCRLEARGKPSSYYLALFDETAFEHDPPVEGQRCFPALFRKTLMHSAEETPPLASAEEFEVLIISQAASPPVELVNTARSVLVKIVELDRIVSRDFDDTKEDGELAWIQIIGAVEADLHYFATHVNSEWSEMLRMKEDNTWEHQGIRRGAAWASE